VGAAAILICAECRSARQDAPGRAIAPRRIPRVFPAIGAFSARGGETPPGPRGPDPRRSRTCRSRAAAPPARRARVAPVRASTGNSHTRGSVAHHTARRIGRSDRPRARRRAARGARRSSARDRRRTSIAPGAARRRTGGSALHGATVHAAARPSGASARAGGRASWRRSWTRHPDHRRCRTGPPSTPAPRPRWDGAPGSSPSSLTSTWRQRQVHQDGDVNVRFTLVEGSRRRSVAKAGSRSSAIGCRRSRRSR
jgi:hypothetical protein